MGKTNPIFLARKRRQARVRKHVNGTAERPRLNIYRSLKHIYAQVIDDTQGITLAAASTLELSRKSPELLKDKNRIEQASEVGKAVAKRAIDAGVAQVVFDRGGYKYHGLIKALAEGSREAGLKF